LKQKTYRATITIRMTKPTRDYIIEQSKAERSSTSLFLRKLVAAYYQRQQGNARAA
jgi:hypothetical protein